VTTMTIVYVLWWMKMQLWNHSYLLFIRDTTTLNSTTNLVWINVKPQWLIPRKRHILSPIIGKKGIELDYEEEEKEEEKEDGASTSITNDEVKLLGGMFALVIKQQTQQSTNIALHDTK